MAKDRKFHAPKGVSKATGYSHAVSASGKTTIYVSGQVSYDAEGTMVGVGDFEAQARQVFANLKAVLKDAGATFSDVVKMTTYIVNYTPELRPTLAAVRAEFLPAKNPPASTLVGVQALALDGLMIEIEAIAVV